jgi:hypothetical protein
MAAIQSWAEVGIGELWHQWLGEGNPSRRGRWMELMLRVNGRTCLGE